MSNFPRITVNADQMNSLPCVRGLRIPVATVLRLLSGGISELKVLDEYPDLQLEDIRECLRFAATTAEEMAVPIPQFS